MSSEPDSAPGRPAMEALRRARALGGRRWAILGANVGASRTLLTGRRRDVSAPIIPFDGARIANALALAVSALAFLVLFVDPHLAAWQATLPGSDVALFRGVTRFGKSDWILIGTGLVVIATLLAETAALTPRQRAVRGRRALAALYVFIAVALPGIASNLAKNVIGRARPKYFDEVGSFAFHPFAGDSGWASFPSGHSTTGFALGVALALLFPRLRWVFLALGFWIAVSRLAVKAHYPSDVLGGALVGALGAWLIARLFARRRLVFRFGADGRLVRRRLS